MRLDGGFTRFTKGAGDHQIVSRLFPPRNPMLDQNQIETIERARAGFVAVSTIYDCIRWVNILTYIFIGGESFVYFRRYLKYQTIGLKLA
jgi:hypothetical protein